jgi:hypothetical protein
VKPHQIKYLKSDIIGHKLQAHTDQANQKSDSHRPWVERRALGKYLLFMLCVIKFCVCVMQGVVWLGQSAGRQKTQWAIMESVMWPIDEWRVVFMPLQPGFVHTHTHTHTRAPFSVMVSGAYLHTWFHDVNFALHCWPVHWLVICRLSGLSSSPLILHPPPYNSLQIRLSHNELCHGRIERERGSDVYNRKISFISSPAIMFLSHRQRWLHCGVP